MISEDQLKTMQDLSGLALKAEPANIALQIIDFLIEELYLSREEARGYKIAAETLRNQNSLIQREYEWMNPKHKDYYGWACLLVGGVVVPGKLISGRWYSFLPIRAIDVDDKVEGWKPFPMHPLSA